MFIVNAPINLAHASFGLKLNRKYKTIYRGIHYKHHLFSSTAKWANINKDHTTEQCARALSISLFLPSSLPTVK